MDHEAIIVEAEWRPEIEHPEDVRHARTPDGLDLARDWPT